MKYCLIYIDNGFKELTQLGEYEGFNEHYLRSFVEFAWKFQDEDCLKEYLYYKGLIDSLNGHFSLGYYKGGNVRILPYSLAYAKDKKYFDINKLLDYYNSHLTDKKFMDQFIDKFVTPLKNTPKLGLALNSIYKDYQRFLSTNLVSNDMHSLMNSFILNYVNVRTKDGVKESFNRLRELAMFVIQFKNNNEVNNTVNNEESIKLQIEHYRELLSDKNLEPDVREAYTEVLNNLEYIWDIINTRRRNR